MANNDSKNLFEIAARKKYRFSYKGWISTEDLWDMDRDGLDSVYKWLTSLKNKSSTEDSLLNDNAKDKEDADLQNKIDIVKHVFEVKKEESFNALKEKENAEKKRRILDILAKKQDEVLMNTKVEDLKKMLEDL